jgi:AcrR family transcriptional regulator
VKNLISNISIQVNKYIYLKDPQSSELGDRIITGSIDLIDEVGFEGFTFRKLGERIGSPEASIYRYFESKHKLLLYLTTWYWAWMEYRLVFGLANIESPYERLEKAIVLLTQQITMDSNFSHIDEIKLYRLVIAEASKSYLTKEVDEENKHGIFKGYKQLVGHVSDIILEINPDYEYPHMLVSTMIEGAHHQRFFADHLPRLTDSIKGKDSITSFYKEMVLKAIEGPK